MSKEHRKKKNKFEDQVRKILEVKRGELCELKSWGEKVT